jgi:hypothetical protein
MGQKGNRLRIVRVGDGFCGFIPALESGVGEDLCWFDVVDLRLGNNIMSYTTIVFLTIFPLY